MEHFGLRGRQGGGGNAYGDLAVSLGANGRANQNAENAELKRRASSGLYSTFALLAAVIIACASAGPAFRSADERLRWRRSRKWWTPSQMGRLRRCPGNATRYSTMQRGPYSLMWIS